jgi:hypothetical protein
MAASRLLVNVSFLHALTIWATVSKVTGSNGSTGTLGAFTLRMGLDHPSGSTSSSYHKKNALIALNAPCLPPAL